MKNLRMIGVLLLGCAVLGTGCATTGAQLSPQTATSLVELRHALAGGKAQLERTSETLRDLVKNPRLNTERQIALFTEDMVRLENEAQRIRDINTDMQAKSEAYFETWRNELEGIENPKIAAAGRKRKKASLETMQAVRQKLDEAKETLSPFMSNLRDINRYLQQDQTVDGVTALTPIIEKTLKMEKNAIKQLDAVIAEVDNVTKSVK